MLDVLRESFYEKRLFLFMVGFCLSLILAVAFSGELAFADGGGGGDGGDGEDGLSGDEAAEGDDSGLGMTTGGEAALGDGDDSGGDDGDGISGPGGDGNSNTLCDTCSGRDCEDCPPPPFVPVCTDSSWTPAQSVLCSGESFTQTSNCNNTRNRTGTMTCQAGGCEIDFNSSATPILSCQNNDVIGKYTFWENIGCSVSTCLWNPIYNSCGDYTQECGDSTCENASGDTEYEYCQGDDVYVKYRGIERGCGGPSGAVACYNQSVDCSHTLKTSCETGYTCKPIDGSNAECIPKSSTWIET